MSFHICWCQAVTSQWIQPWSTNTDQTFERPSEYPCGSSEAQSSQTQVQSWGRGMCGENVPPAVWTDSTLQLWDLQPGHRQVNLAEWCQIRWYRNLKGTFNLENLHLQWKNRLYIIRQTLLICLDRRFHVCSNSTTRGRPFPENSSSMMDLLVSTCLTGIPPLFMCYLTWKLYPIFSVASEKLSNTGNFIKVQCYLLKKNRNQSNTSKNTTLVMKI